MTLRVGIAGYGVVGKRRRQFVDAHPELEMVAACDRRFDGQEIAEGGIRLHTDYQRLLEEQLDILFVCLTNDIAPDVTIAGLESGLHVLCEKPPGRDLSDMARVASVAARHSAQKLKYGFNHRYHHSVQRSLELIRSGELGAIVNLRGVYGKSAIIDFQSDWRTKRAIAGGGILLDQGIHMVDLLRLFAGEFSEVKSFVSNDFWNHDVEDNAYALMRTPEGVVAILHSSATQWQHRFQLELALEKGSIVLSGILSGSKSYGEESLTIARRNDGSAVEAEDTLYFDEDPSWQNEIAEFVDAIRDDSPIVHGSVDDAIDTMRLVYRIYCADESWRRRWELNDAYPPVES